MQTHVPMFDRVSQLTLAACILVLAGACADQSTAPPPAADRVAASFARGGGGRHIIVLKAPGSQAAVMDAVKAAGGTVSHDHGDAGLLTVSGLTDAAAATIRSRLDVAAVAADSKLQWVAPLDPNAQRVQYNPSTAPAVPSTQGDQSGAYFYTIGYQWNMVQVHAIDAQRASTGGAGKTVCVLDTGVDPGQLDLAGRVNLDISRSFVPDEPFIEDLNFHGTHTSSTVTSNGIAIASVAPNATLCMVKVLDASGSGEFDWVIDGIIYAANSKKRGGAGADVINMSLGAYLDRSEPGTDDLIAVLQAAVNYAWKHGTVVVASAGNSAIDLAHDGPQFLTVPAELKHVTTVGATGPIDLAMFDHFASYSNYGRNDISAPGGEVLGTTAIWYHDFVLAACSRYVCGADGYYVWAAGTSMAAPHVSGAAAVVMSMMGRENEPEDVVERLTESADKVGPRYLYGAGRLNVLRAVTKGHGSGSRDVVVGGHAE